MAFGRDPVAVLFDEGAARLLARAYARPGATVSTRLENPTLRHLAWGAVIGDNLAGPDYAAGRAARTRWARGFVNSLYYNHDPRRGALVVEVGRAQPALGVIPAGRIIRARVLPGGHAARAAVAALGEERRYVSGGARWSDPRNRPYP